MSASIADIRLPAQQVAEVLTRVRERSPLVHCMTNIVVAGFTANVLLAIGASPAMVENDEESAEFAGISDALLVNLGTLSAERVRAMRAATAAAQAAGTHWVLDPVAVGALAFRTKLAIELLEHRPRVIRGNPSEILSLAGAAGAGRGVDSTAGSSQAVPAARELAARIGGVVAVSGEVDYLTDGDRVLQVHTGHPMMTKVTGMGCALGSLVAACGAVEDDPLVAAATATSLLTVAAEAAIEISRGPGSLAFLILDALYAMDEATLAKHLER